MIPIKLLRHIKKPYVVTFADVPIARFSSKNKLVIECKNKFLNMYEGQVYRNLNDVPLASKGWTSNKSRGDFFKVHANLDDYDKPCESFHNLNTNVDIITALSKLDITKATSFQNEAIPKVRSGNHTSLIAETGCGKTLAYLIPILENLTKIGHCNEMNSPRALIVAPNRELAQQIGSVVESLISDTGLKSKVIIGGQTKRTMTNPQFSDIDVLVGTPGVICKLSTVGIYKLNDVKFTVLDEGDSLLDDTFNDRLQIIIRRVALSQIILVSATLPKNPPECLADVLADSVQVKSPRLHMPLKTVTQKFMRTAKTNKPAFLLQIAKAAKDPLLVFTSRNETSRWLAMYLRENNLKCSNINGDMNYHVRTEQWGQFVRGETGIISATDVISRGLDLGRVNHVLNYDFPIYPAEYIHRIGRTGRLGGSLNCKVTNLICRPLEVNLVQQIEVSSAHQVVDRV